MRTLALLPCLVAAMACGGLDRTVVLTDVGSACWREGEVQVTFPTCISSSCDTVASASCRVTAEGTELVVTGETVIRERQRIVCSKDCGTVVTTCPAAVPPEGGAGGWTLTYAGTTTALSDARCPDAATDSGTP